MASDDENTRKLKEVFQDGKTRFVLELEFVSLLANPRYLHRKFTRESVREYACSFNPIAFSMSFPFEQFTYTDLAQQRTLEDPAFINYLVSACPR